MAYENDEEVEKKWKEEESAKEKEPAEDWEEEIDLAEYGETIRSRLKVVIKAEDFLVTKMHLGDVVLAPKSLWRVIPNLVGPPQVHGEDVMWYSQYGGRYIDERCKGIGHTPLLDKIFDFIHWHILWVGML